MLYHLFYFFRHDVTGFNVVRYITFRTAVASLTALFLVLILGPWMIERLRRLQVGQYIREEGPQAHQSKKGTPTMGGLLILAGIVIPTLLWANLTNRNVWIAVLSTLAFGAIGFVIGVIVYGFARVDPASYSTRITVPFFKNLLPDLALLYIPFAVLFVA